MNEILATIGAVDITKYIIKDTYKVATEPTFESWLDGNFHEHRIYVRDRMKGSFDLIFFDEDNGAYQNFLSLLNANTTNRLLSIGLFVLDKSQFEAFQVYYSISPVQYAETTDGRRVNKITFNVEEY